jgi:membrane protease YdiL (CAAX protease family)
MSYDEPDVPAELPEEPGPPPASPFVPVVLVPVAAPRPPRVWTVFVVYVLALVSSMVAAGVLMVILALQIPGPTIRSSRDFARALETTVETPSGFLSTLLCTAIVIGAVASIAAAVSPVAWRERLRLRSARFTFSAVLVSICGIVAIGLSASAMDGLGWLPESQFLGLYDEMVSGMSGLTLLAAVLVIGGAPGIAEELLFRGYIQTRLSQRWGPGLAVLCTAFLFGLIHFDLVQGTFAFGMGLFLGWLTERTGSIWPAIVCHVGNNTFSTLATAAEVEIVGPLANATALAASVAVLGFAVWYLRRFFETPESPAAADANGG